MAFILSSIHWKHVFIGNLFQAHSQDNLILIYSLKIECLEKEIPPFVLCSYIINNSSQVFFLHLPGPLEIKYQSPPSPPHPLLYASPHNIKKKTSNFLSIAACLTPLLLPTGPSLVHSAAARQLSGPWSSCSLTLEAPTMTKTPMHCCSRLKTSRCVSRARGGWV